MSMPNSGGWSPNPFGFTPGPRADPSEPEARPCARCGHRADSHDRPGSCTVRGRWWRRCPCSGYTGLGSAAPAAPGPRSPAEH